MTGDHIGSRPTVTRVRRQRDQWALLLVIAGGFLARFALADRNSYWLDEHYSVLHYGIDHPTLWAAVIDLANSSIHPPLYQIILYCWMWLFGDHEVATRTLSNLYIAGATYFLYRTVAECATRRVALSAAIVFSLMYTPVYYALEARSYAQTVFLVSLSSWLMLLALRSLDPAAGWRHIVAHEFRGPVLANLAVLLTHYYNFFFLAAQSTFLLGYLLFVARGHDLSTSIRKTALVSAAPVIGLLVVWGHVIIGSFKRYSRSGEYAVEGTPSMSFAGMLREMGLGSNLDLSAWVYGFAVLLIGSFLAAKGLRMRRGGEEAVARGAMDFYFLAWFALPFLFAYVAFAVAGHERYSGRYFAFTAPALAVLAAFALEQLSNLAARFWRTSRRFLVRFAPATALLFAVVVVGPGGYKAATETKTDYRGIVGQIVDHISAHPERRYFIYETSFRPKPTLNYYLARRRHEQNLVSTVTRADEREGQFRFESDRENLEMQPGDRVVLAFAHHATRSFPKAIEEAGRVFRFDFEMLNRRGSGFMVFEVR